MFSDRFSWTKHIGFRMILGFCVLFVISSAGVFLLVYSLFSKSLSKRDHSIVSAKSKEYVAIFEKDGIGGLKNRINEDRLSDILVRLEGRSDETVFFHAQLNSAHFDLGEIGKILAARKGKRWIYISGKDEDSELEVLTVPLENGMQLQIGMTTDNREDLLDRLQTIFAGALLLTVGVGVAGGIFFSYRTLLPVRSLISTIQTIQAGDLQVRVPQPNTGDEMDMLISLFNEMLDRIQRLIVGMRETLDNVSHDLRTPMTRFRALAETALARASTVADYRETMMECLEESDEIIAMMNSLMDISEAEAGTMRLNVESFDPRPLITEVKELYELVADERGVSIHAECGVELSALGDRRRIKQVLANLVDNAIKYSNPNGKVELSAFSMESGVQMVVRDDGIGIASPELPRIWDRLYRGDVSRSTPGLGLGLSLVRSIVEAHGGTVHVKSEVGRGSRFEIHLPGPV